jgi:membrane protein DedA with SNARE-associated domain
VAASAGNLSADALWYALGRSGRIENAVRYGRWLGLHEEQIYQLEAGVRQNATRILLVAKLTAGLVIPALIAAGLVRAPWRRWFLPVFAAEMVWTGGLVLGGYYATAYLSQIERGVTYAVAGASLLVLLFLGYKAFGLRKKRKRSIVQPGDAQEPTQPKRENSV